MFSVNVGPDMASAQADQFPITMGTLSAQLTTMGILSAQWITMGILSNIY